MNGRLPILGQPNPDVPKDVHLVGRYALGAGLVQQRPEHRIVRRLGRLFFEDGAPARVSSGRAAQVQREYLSRLRVVAEIQLDATAEHHIAIAEEHLTTGRAQFGFEQSMIAKARLAERRDDPATAFACS